MYYLVLHVKKTDTMCTKWQLQYIALLTAIFFMCLRAGTYKV